MEKYKNIISVISISIILNLVSCTATKNETSNSSSIPPNAIQATVVDFRELDGCEFLILTSDGKKLQPINLQANFKKNGTQLFITYKVAKGISICMAGEMVELLFVQEQK